jgi:hypothetical protein
MIERLVTAYHFAVFNGWVDTSDDSHSSTPALSLKKVFFQFMFTELFLKHYLNKQPRGKKRILDPRILVDPDGS